MLFNKKLLFISLLALSFHCFAKDSLFYSPEDEKIEHNAMLDMAAYAFANRRWTVSERTEGSFLANIDRQGVKAIVRIYLIENDLYYQCTGTRTRNVRRSGGGSPAYSKRALSTSFCPERWIDNAQRDLAGYLKQ